jgi:hypothetical protein
MQNENKNNKNKKKEIEKNLKKRRKQNITVLLFLSNHFPVWEDYRIKLTALSKKLKLQKDRPTT